MSETNLSCIMPGASCAWPRRVGRWAAVQSEYRQEKTAAASIGDLGFLVYLPAYKTKRKDERNHRKEIDTTRPLFPGYLFVDVSSQQGRTFGKARGVRDVVRMGEALTLVPDQLIAALRAAEPDNFGLPYTGTPGVEPFKAGEMVRLTDGPFRLFMAEIASVDDKGRLALLVEVFGRVSLVNGLSIEQIERV